MSYDALGEISNESLMDITQQQLTWDSFGRLVTVSQTSDLAPTFNKQWGSTYSWKTVYDGLGRRIQTTCFDNGQNAIINYQDSKPVQPVNTCGF